MNSREPDYTGHFPQIEEQGRRADESPLHAPALVPSAGLSLTDLGNILLRMNTSEFDYHLPEALIAQEPVEPRDAARLLHLDRAGGTLEQSTFRDLVELLRPGDMLVANNSRVIPARLLGHKVPSGGRVEILLLNKLGGTRWQVMIGGKRVVPGTRITVHNQSGEPSSLHCTVTEEFQGPLRELAFSEPVEQFLMSLGSVPLPSYIRRELADPERYQTVYAQPEGSAAAPTAGLHFTGDLLLKLRAKGVQLEWCTLHIGLDTFKPVATETVEAHHIHSEWAELTPTAAQRINEAKLSGGRLIAVGTTSVRVLETAALRSAGYSGALKDISARDAQDLESTYCPWRPVAAFSGPTDLYIYPGFCFRVVDALITNFHLPRSSLLMLVSAFAGRHQLMEAYEYAIKTGFRFYSFGDAMLIS